MFFKDHLLLVTDAGVTLHLGWDYDIPYLLTPLNGVDVDLQLAQGVNQTGTTVERQSVAGVYRTLTASFWGGDADARRVLRGLPWYTSGTMYFEDKYFARFVVSKTPYFSQVTPYPRAELMLYSPKPYWYSLTAQSYVLGGFQAAFSFPVCYTSHHFSTALQDTFANVRNPGSLPVPFTCTLTASLPVTNPRIVNAITGEYIGFADTTLQAGDVVEIYRSTSDKVACKLTRAGVQSNIFAWLDEGSTLTELAAGDNLLKVEADSGVDYLQASVSFYPMEVGILPERL